MAEVSLSLYAQYAVGSSGGWNNTGSSDAYRYYLGLAVAYRPRFVVSVPDDLSENTNGTLIIRMRNDEGATPRYMRAYLSDTNYTNFGSDEILKSTSRRLAMSYLYTTENKTAQAVSYQSAGTDSYFVFDISLTPGQTYYIYIIPYTSNSAAITSPAYSSPYTYYRGRSTDTYLSAKYIYQRSLCRITYDANDGIGEIEDQIARIGEITVLSGAITRKNKDVPSHIIQFNKNGGTSAPPLIESTERTSYSFVSWNTRKDGFGVDYYADSEFIPEGDIVLYAKWSSNTIILPVELPSGYAYSQENIPGFIVRFISNGATSTPVLKQSVISVNYSFSSWNTKSDGSGESYSAGTLFTPSEGTMLYARYTKVITNYGSVSLTAPSKPKFTFVGWSLTNDKDGLLPSMEYTPMADTVLYAIWREGGTVYIGNESLFESYSAYIGTGESFERYIPYIFDGTRWRI